MSKPKINVTGRTYGGKTIVADGDEVVISAGRRVTRVRSYSEVTVEAGQNGGVTVTTDGDMYFAE